MSGTLDFRNETLDLSIRPRVRQGIPIEIPQIAELVRFRGPLHRADGQRRRDGVGDDDRAHRRGDRHGRPFGARRIAAVAQRAAAGAGACDVALGKAPAPRPRRRARVAPKSGSSANAGRRPRQRAQGSVRGAEPRLRATAGRRDASAAVPALTSIKSTLVRRGARRSIAADETQLVRRLGAHCAIAGHAVRPVRAWRRTPARCTAPAAPAAMAHVADAHGSGAGFRAPAMAGHPHAPQANACEVHCTDGVTLPAQPDLPQVVAGGAAGRRRSRSRSSRRSAEAARTPDAALPGAPPPTLQFCRLLI